ncbi:MAG TPA: dehydrogenase E1 component subunit alpha/beta [Candidatus Polarisedimenticolaceae bacterium]|nr:dehydrogenase E1 component subunit alpha/beta [Candidatus Polarisedimenticolaceae bacterium]
MARETRTRTQALRGLDRQALLDLYRTMLLSRKIDDKEIQLKRQNRIFFQINSAGHEALGAAIGHVFRPGHDWFFFYYRDRAAALGLGITPDEMFLQAAGSSDDPQSGARQMPAHFSAVRLNVANTSSPTGSQFLQAVGCAEGGLYAAGRGLDVRHAADEVTVVTAGDGTTSEGEFWEAVSTASNRKLPVIFVIEDNGYAISVPVEVNTPGGSISKLVASFPDLLIREVDGCDVLDTVEALQAAAAHTRARRGPALVHAHVIRPYSHSLSDDETQYRTADERTAEAGRDPLVTFPELLVREGVVDRGMLEALEQQVASEVQQAADRAFQAPRPEPESALLYVYSPQVDPTSERFSTAPHLEGQPGTMVDLLNKCLADELRRDERIVMFGEDVADCSREDALAQVKGKGGVFKVTLGLQREFGSDRVFNAPLAEANIVGRAIGMALRGLKPVVEIQFFDYIWPAYHQIRSELATLRWRSGNSFSAPVVIRTTYGGYIRGGAIYHSQSGAALFTANPGLRVICPATALDANGLLRTAIRSDDPVLFLEHKHLYRQTYNKSPYPGPEYMIPFGRAAVVRPGGDVTVITYGATVQRALQASRGLEEAGISVEVIDLRSLSPLDWETISASARKTSKVLVLYEDSRSWGYGAEIAARLADELYTELDAPVRRLAATDTFVGYAPELEDFILPQVEDIKRAVEDLAAW